MSLTRFQRDVLERAVRTFLQSALAVVAVELANPNVTLDSLQAATIAGLAAGLSALMAWLGRFVGDPESGSWES